MRACSECEFNYQLKDGKCNYNEKDKRECCVSFNQNGECSKCQTGMFLNSGACDQAFLAGCIEKRDDYCVNCARDYFLKDGGLCGVGVQNCLQYSLGKCSVCKESFYLNKTSNTCLPNRILGCADQVQSKCKSCFKPFVLTNSICKISSCDVLGEFGCTNCSSQFYLKPDGLCYPT